MAGLQDLVRATSAATTFFKPIKYGRNKIEFCDAGFGTNNPCEVLVDEAARAFPSNEISCILSIGTGLGRAVEITGNPVSILGALKKMATSPKTVDDRMQRSKFNGPVGRAYWRFDEKVGVGDLQLDDWKKLSKLSGLTHNYINTLQTETEINACVSAILIARPAAPDVDPKPEISIPHLYFEVPYDRNVDFVPQVKAFAHLRDFFQGEADSSDSSLPGILNRREDTQSLKKTVLYGTGGVGRTQLAKEYAYSRQPFQSVFWINADSATVMESSIKDVTMNLDLPILRGSKILTARRFRTWLESWHTDWLLIIDNADNSEIFADVPPSKGRVHILFTNRDKSILSSEFVNNKGFHVDTMPEQVALQMFLSRLLRSYEVKSEEIKHFVEVVSNAAPKSWPPGFPATILRPLEDDFGISKYADLQELVQEVNCLPLGFVQSAAYMSFPDFEIKSADFIERLRGMNSRKKGFFKFKRLGAPYPHSLGSVWELSFEKLKQGNPVAAELLRFFAFLDRRSILQDFLRNLLSENVYWEGNLEFSVPPDVKREARSFLPDGQYGPDLEDSLREISKLSFLEITRDRHVQLHHLVQEWLYLCISEESALNLLDLTCELLDHQLPPLLYSDNDREVLRRYPDVVLHINRNPASKTTPA